MTKLIAYPALTRRAESRDTDWSTPVLMSIIVTESEDWSMDLIFAEAVAAARTIHGPVGWATLSPHVQTDTIYREMRRLDLERASRPVMVDPPGSKVSLRVAA